MLNLLTSDDVRRRASRSIGALILATSTIAVSASNTLAEKAPWDPIFGNAEAHVDRLAPSSEQAYIAPITRDVSRCERGVIDALLHGTAASHGLSTAADYERGAAFLSEITTALVPSGIGIDLDQSDHTCIAQALSHLGDGKSLTWRNTQDKLDLQVTPTDSYRSSDGAYCRRYSVRIEANGRTELIHDTACRTPGGSWRLIG